MDIDKLIQFKHNRQTREGKPFNNFYESFSELMNAAEFTKSNADFKFHHMLEKSIVIGAVTAIETYYKDMLDMIFRSCSPNFIKPILKDIHKFKYDIDDLITMHEENIHPLELIAGNQNFQNAEIIESIFSKFLKKSLWGSIIGTKIRIKDKSDTEIEFDDSDLTAIKKLFKKRHELVHNAAQREIIITDEFIEILAKSMGFVFMSNIEITKMIIANLDPCLNKKTIN